MSICTGAAGGLALRSRNLLVKLAHLMFVSTRNAVAHVGRALTKSLELFADWAAFPSMFAVVTRDSAGPNSVCKVWEGAQLEVMAAAVGDQMGAVADEGARRSLCHVRPRARRSARRQAGSGSGSGCRGSRLTVADLATRDEAKKMLWT